MHRIATQSNAEQARNAKLPNSSEMSPVSSRARLFHKLLACPEFQRVVGIKPSNDVAIDEINGVLTCSFGDGSVSVVNLGSNQYTARWKILVKKPNQPTSEFFVKTWPTATQRQELHNLWLAHMEQLKARIQTVSESCADALCKVPKILGFGVIEADRSDSYGTQWIMTEYVSGQSLEQMFLRDLHDEQAPRITGKQAYQITQAVLEALARF